MQNSYACDYFIRTDYVIAKLFTLTDMCKNIFWRLFHKKSTKLLIVNGLVLFLFRA
jgi:hypothetical protein